MPSIFSYYCDLTLIHFFTLHPTIMNTTTHFGTPVARVVVLRAHSSEQMAKVIDCIHAGHPVTLYADHLTDEIKRFAGLSFVQTRIGQQNIPLVEDESVIVFH